MSYTRLLFETSVDTRSPGLNTNRCHLVSEMFKYRWLPSPGRPEEAHEATQRGMVLLPSITPLPPHPHSPALFTEATGCTWAELVCGPGLTVTHKAEALRETQGPSAPGGGDGVCCCRTWMTRAGPGGSPRHRGGSGRFSPQIKLVTGGTGEGEGVAAERAGALPWGLREGWGQLCRCPGSRRSWVLLGRCFWMLSQCDSVPQEPSLPAGRGPASTPGSRSLYPAQVW